MELEDVLEIVCREARALTGATGSAVLILEDGEWLRVAHTVGALRTGSDRLPIEGSFAGLVARTGEPLLINNAYREMLAYRQYGRLEALLSLPLVAQENIIGTLDLVNKPGGFGADDLRVMMLFANQAAIAIENARLLQQGEQLAVLQERHRLSRELHDSVTQALYSLTLYADAIRIALRNERYDDARSNLAELREVAREAMVEMRLLVFRLHPPLVEEEGLVSALQHRLAAVESRAGLRTQLLADEVNDLPLEVQQTLYGVAQEALNNVVKHAQADEVTVGLWRKDGGLVLEVADDGLGMDPNKAEASGGMGLRSMRERAAAIGGDLLIETQEGEGTVVRVRIDKGAAGE
jgi:signal transduction histidine kinase